MSGWSLGLGDKRHPRDKAECVTEVLELELRFRVWFELRSQPGTSEANSAASFSPSGVPFSQGSQCCLASSLIGPGLVEVRERRDLNPRPPA